jgi:hypothetical protein
MLRLLFAHDWLLLNMDDPNDESVCNFNALWLMYFVKWYLELQNMPLTIVLEALLSNTYKFYNYLA